MKQKNPKTLFKGGIASAVLAAIMLVIRIVMGTEVSRVENSHAAIVDMGVTQMSRSDYLAFAGKMNIITTILLIVFALMAIGLLVMYKKSKKQ